MTEVDEFERNKRFTLIIGWQNYTLFSYLRSNSKNFQMRIFCKSYLENVEADKPKIHKRFKQHLDCWQTHLRECKSRGSALPICTADAKKRKTRSGNGQTAS
jgi:hypothetical protein